MPTFLLNDELIPIYWLLAALVMLYVGARTLFAAFARRLSREATPLVVAQGVAVGTCALTALVMRQPELAVGLVFAVALANVSLVLGLAGLSGPIETEDEPLSPAVRRMMSTVLLVGLMLLLCGFRGHFTALHAVVLLVEGAAIVGLHQASRAQVAAAAGHEVAVKVDERQVRATGMRRRGRIFWLITGVLLLVLGIILLETVIHSRATPFQRLVPLLHGSTLIGPIVLLPTIALTVLAAQRGRGQIVAAATVGATLVHLCVLIPVMIGFWQLLRVERISAWITRGLATLQMDRAGVMPEHLPFPMPSWRVEAVALVIAGLFLLGVASRRIPMGRATAVLLVIGYMLCLMISAAIAMRF